MTNYFGDEERNFLKIIIANIAVNIPVIENVAACPIDPGR